MTSLHGAMGWADRPGHRRWLAREGDRILDFYQWACVDPDGGFDWLDEHGVPEPGGHRELWINARMVYVYALAHLTGRPGAQAMVKHGLQFLTTQARDERFGGWYRSVAPDGTPDDATKECYGHAFVLLAAGTAALAGWAPARDLLHEVTTVITSRFWDEREGLCVDSYDRQWADLADYRGQNANMHMVEAFLTAAEATGDEQFLARAARIATRIIREQAAAHHWRVPEHYDTQWHPLLERTSGTPDAQFRPAGSTVGHWFEWARLLVQLRASPAGEAWMLDAAIGLFDRAATDGWDEKRTGLIFSVDFDGRPLDRDRYHWPVAEAIGAAVSLWRVTGDPVYEQWYQRFWSFADRYLIDRRLGGWRHQLDAQNRPTDTVWHGRPDAYHAYQATLFASAGVHSTVLSGLLLQLDHDGPHAAGER